MVVNTDADPPMFQTAGFGVAGDLFKVVPQLIEELKRRKCAA